MPELAELRKQPALLVAAGAAATVRGGAVAAYRACERLPVVGTWLRSGRAELARRGDEAIARSAEPLKALVTAISVDIARLVLAELDLTEMVREAVDLDAIVSEIDIDAIAARLDRDIRTQGERADDMVSGFVDRMLGRDRESR